VTVAGAPERAGSDPQISEAGAVGDSRRSSAESCNQRYRHGDHEDSLDLTRTPTPFPAPTPRYPWGAGPDRAHHIKGSAPPVGWRICPNSANWYPSRGTGSTPENRLMPTQFPEAPQ
jgi:hypothetical protein